jgi:hypothetical protein
MSVMRIGAGHLRGKTPLVVRGSLPRTFLSLGLFLETGLLVCGTYLLVDAILQPLEAGPAAVLSGGLFLALATMLLFYLAWPTQGKSMSQRNEPVERPPEQLLTAYGSAMQTRVEAKWVMEEEDELPGPM